MKELQSLKSLVLSKEERGKFLNEIGSALPTLHFERIAAVFELLPKVVELLEQKNVSLAKLRALVFGAKTESARTLCGGPSPAPPKRAKRKGHGRRGHRSYTGAQRRRTLHANLKPGDLCPGCLKGKVRELKEPATLIQVSAQPPIQAVVHELQRLRCHRCNALYTAKAPPGTEGEKYDLSTGVMVGMLRYGAGVPSHRLAKLQESLGVPLPGSVQWEQSARVAGLLEPIIDALLYIGAQVAVFHNDDTPMRVASLRKEIKAGENLARVLAEREPGLDPPLHRCDGLSRNAPQGHAVRDCNCNVHARRNFVDLRAAFPEDSQHVIECYSTIYRAEAQAKQEQLDPDQRLRLHQRLSQPVLDQLKLRFTQSLETRQVEPNSGLGQSINYRLERWEPLTQFLRIPGAPLDNNIDERLLKTAILHRKNSPHYKTVRGTAVGDFYMSVIQTCVANGVNPHDYQLSAVRHADAGKKDPGRWLPWNYQTALTAAASPAPPRPAP